MEIAKSHGYAAIELCVGAEGTPFGLDAEESFCRDLRAEAEQMQLALLSIASGIYWERSLGDSDPRARAQAQEDLNRLIHITHWLGANTLLTIPGSVDVFFLPDREAIPYDEVWSNASQGLQHVIPLAENLGVRLGIENVWNRFLVSPREMASFIDQFGSAAIGAYVDVGNVMLMGYPQDWIRHLGRRVIGVHFKDFRRSVGTVDGFVDLLEGDVPWSEVIRALADIQYRGPVVAEMIPEYREQPVVRVANTSRAMDAILALSD